MSQQNKTTLQQSINTQLADNSAGEISAADVRSNMISITDSLVFNNEDQSIVGSIELTGDVTASAFLGDGSALTNLPVTPTFPYTGDAQITGKIILNDGNNNVSIGQNALYTNVNGQYNTAVGVQALYSNTTGGYNIAIGNSALYSNTTGGYNIAIGLQALFANTTGADNTANGFRALYNNTTGGGNTANGTAALYNNTTGASNTANGVQALFANTTGSNNTANGHGALFHKVTGDTNVAIGTDAGRVLADKGSSATTINDSIFIGYRTSPLANSQTNQIVIGHDATGLGSNTIVLGNDQVTTTALTGNVGIGTTTPAEKLTVEGNISGSGNVNILGDVTASAFIGDGSALTGLPVPGGTLAVNQITDTGKTYNDGTTIFPVYSVSFYEDSVQDFFGGIFPPNAIFDPVFDFNDVKTILDYSVHMYYPEAPFKFYDVKSFGGSIGKNGTWMKVNFTSTRAEIEAATLLDLSICKTYGTVEFTSATIDVSSLSSPGGVIPAVIIQDDGSTQHGQLVRDTFIAQNSNYVASDFQFNASTLAYSFAAQYGVDMIIRSTTGLTSYANLSEQYKGDVLLVMPLGDNNYVELDYNGELYPWVICTGAGDTENRTSFGNNLDFFDEDDVSDASFISSYSNGRIAGKLKAIKDARASTWWDTINAARETATRTATTHPSSGKWNKNNGYGIIDVSAAIAYTGTLPATPYYNE